jgi:hypothetical protein
VSRRPPPAPGPPLPCAARRRLADAPAECLNRVPREPTGSGRESRSAPAPTPIPPPAAPSSGRIGVKAWRLVIALLIAVALVLLVSFVLRMTR